MEKEIKIIAPEGYEIDKVNSTFECIKFRETKNKYPTSLKEISNRLYFINSFGAIEKVVTQHKDINQLSSKERAEAFLALMQLVELRDAWNKIDGFVVDWNNASQTKYTIIFRNSVICDDEAIHINRVLYFGSRTTRDLFSLTFRELIETAKELL